MSHAHKTKFPHLTLYTPGPAPVFTQSPAYLLALYNINLNPSIRECIPIVLTVTQGHNYIPLGTRGGGIVVSYGEVGWEVLNRVK